MRYYLVLFIVFFTSSCGKDNQVDTSTLNTSGNSSVTSQEVATFQSLYPCSMGNRMSDMKFTTTEYQLYGSTIYGTFAPGVNSSGQPMSKYVGFSNFNDIMILEKLGNGSNVTGYNVTLSFCEQSPLLVQGRNYSNFYAPNGITISDNLNCSYGSILSSLTYIYADYYNGAEARNVDTVFTISTSPSCPL